MKRVAAYCRVSTDKEDQANSFESQKRYFRECIERNPDWELFNVYADMYNQRLIQRPAYESVGKWLKQRLSADLDGLPKALFFYALERRSDCESHLNPRRSQNKNVYGK